MKLSEEQLIEMEKHIPEFRNFIKERKLFYLQNKATLYKNIHNYWELFTSLVNIDSSNEEVKRYLILLHKVFDTMPNVDKLKAVKENPFLRHFVVFDFNKIMKERRWVEILAFCNDLVLTDYEIEILIKYKTRLIDGIEDSLKKRVYLDYRRLLVKIGVLQRKTTIKGEYLKSMTKATIENIKWDIKFLFDLGYDADEIVEVMKNYFDDMKHLITAKELFFMFDLIQYVNDREYTSFWSVIRIFLFMLEHIEFNKTKFSLEELEKYYYEYSEEKKVQTTLDILGSSLEYKIVLSNKKYLYKRTRFLWEKYKHNKDILNDNDKEQGYSEYTRELVQVFKIFGKFVGREINNYKDFVFNMKSLYQNEALIWVDHPVKSEKYLFVLVNVLLLISSPLLKSVNGSYVNADNLLSFISFYRIKMEELYFSSDYNISEVVDTFKVTDSSNKISYELVENGVNSLSENYYLFHSDLLRVGFDNEEITNKFRKILFDNVIKKIDGIDALRVINNEPFIKKLLNYDISKIIKESEALDFEWWHDVSIFRIDANDKSKLAPFRDKLLARFNLFKLNKNRQAQYAFGSILAQMEIIKDKKSILEIFAEFDDTSLARNNEKDFITIFGYLLSNGYSISEIIDATPFFRFSFKDSSYIKFVYDYIIQNSKDGKEIIDNSSKILAWNIYLHITEIAPDRYEEIINAMDTKNFNIESYTNCFSLFYNYELNTMNVNDIVLNFNGEAFRLNVSNEADFELYGLSKLDFEGLVEHNANEVIPHIFNALEIKVVDSYEEEIKKFIDEKLNDEKKHRAFSMFTFNNVTINKLVYALAFKRLISDKYKLLWETRDKLKKLTPTTKEISDEDMNYYSLIIMTDFIKKNIK